MAAIWTAYKNLVKVMDVTVNVLAANQTDYSLPTSSSGNTTTGSNQASLTNSNISSQVPQGQVWDVCLVVVTPPVASDASQPDLGIWFDNGSQSQRGYQVFDCARGPNMLPDLDHLAVNPTAGPQIPLWIGQPTRDVLIAAASGRIPGGNIPSLITGYKVDQQLVCHVSSLAGWSATPIVPGRIRAYAAVYQATDLQVMASLGYSGLINWNIPPVAPFQTVHEWPGFGTIAGWAQGPGGYAQVGPKVNRRIVYGYNAVAVTGQTALSQYNAVQGAVGNVSSADTTNQKNQFYDLGFVGTGTNKAIFVDRVGTNLYNPGDEAYIAWRVDGQVEPQETNNGVYISSNVNHLAYGAASVVGTGGAGWTTLGSVDMLARVFFNGNNVAPIVQPAGATTSIGIGNLSVAYSGVEVEG